MAITATVSNEFKYEKGKGNVDFSSDTFKCILMAPGFTFDKDVHGTYSDVSGEEISSTGGYTVGGQTLSTDSAWAQDNTNDKGSISWSDESFAASGADMDTFCAAIMYDDSHGSDVIVGCIDLGADVTIPDGESFQLRNLSFDSE